MFFKICPTFKCAAVGKFALNTMIIFLLLGREVLVANRLGNVESLSFDWISRNLYWTDGGIKSVSVMRLADKSRRQIISNLNNPRSIVVHPTAGYVRAWNCCTPLTVCCPGDQPAHSLSTSSLWRKLKSTLLLCFTFLGSMVSLKLL